VVKLSRWSTVLIAAVFGLGCAGATSTVARAPGAAPDAGRWADSVLATLSPRDRAAQLVWPQLFGDYTPTSSAGWIRVQQLIAGEHVGGFIMSIGSPTETAEKLNAMQRLSALPLVIGADYETGVAFRQRGGYFLPNNIYLGGGTMFPYQMGLGATRDTTLAYQEDASPRLKRERLVFTSLSLRFSTSTTIRRIRSSVRARSAKIRRSSRRWARRSSVACRSTG